MTRILKRGQKTYFKEDVVACLADETMQKTFTQSEYGNRIVFMADGRNKIKLCNTASGGYGRYT